MTARRPRPPPPLASWRRVLHAQIAVGARLRDDARRARSRRRPARSPPRSTRRASLRAAEQRHGARGRKGKVPQARVALGRAGRLPGKRPARLRALRQAEARRLRLPAEGHLPARAGGRDRHDHRASRASRAPRSRSCSPRTTSSPTTRRPPRRPCCSAARRTTSTRPDPRHRLARLLLGEGPQAGERLDHRRGRRAAVAELRQRLGHGRRRVASSPRSRATTPSSRAAWTRCSPRRSAPDKARVSVSSRPERRRVHARQAHLRQEGHPAQADQGVRAPARRGLDLGRLDGYLEQPAQLRGQRRGRRQLELQPLLDPDRLRRRQDRPAHEGRPRARSTA